MMCVFTQEFLNKFPRGKVPCVELSGGQLLDESNAAAWWLCPDNMTGSGDREAQSSILRWISLAELEVTPAACSWVYPLAGVMPASPDMDRGRQDVLAFLSWLDGELRLRTWLVGERISLADISLMTSLLLVFTNALDPAMKVPFMQLITKLNIATVPS